MALILYLTRVPKVQDLATGEYHSIPLNDLIVVNKFFDRQRAKEMGTNIGNTFEEWCGISEDNLPDSWTISCLSDSYLPRTFYHELWGRTETYSIFDQVARIPKANQIFRWFIENIMDGKPDKDYHEVSRIKLLRLLYRCNRVRKSCEKIGKDDLQRNIYSVNEEKVKDILPLLENNGFFFGTDKYESCYARDVIKTFYTIRKIIKTTDFEKETIYFNATW